MATVPRFLAPVPYHSPMTVRLARDMDLPVLIKPGGGIRVALAEFPDGSGKRSGTWRFFTGRNTPDIYLAARQIAGVAKVSLHASGKNKHSFINDDEASRFVPPGASRHLDEWDRPPQQGGWVREYSIILPHDELDVWPDDDHESGDVVFMHPVGPGYALEIMVFRVAADATANVTIDDCDHLADLALNDGSVARIVPRRFAIDDSRRQWINQKRRDALTRKPPIPVDAGMLRMGLHGINDDDASRWTYELMARNP